MAVILFLAWMIEQTDQKDRKIFYHDPIVMLPVLPIAGLVGASNLSTAIIILGIAGILIFAASPKYGQFLWMAAAGAGFMGIFLALESYRLERLEIWRNPEKFEKGYQTLQGLYAIGSGGLFGQGLGKSIQKLGFLPEAQNDMIFSIICEELGLVGAGLILLLFLIMIWRFFVIATHAQRSVWRVDRGGSHGAYDDPGDLKYCRGDKQHSQYRDYTSVCKLRRIPRLCSF